MKEEKKCRTLTAKPPTTYYLRFNYLSYYKSKLSLFNKNS